MSPVNSARSSFAKEIQDYLTEAPNAYGFARLFFGEEEAILFKHNDQIHASVKQYLALPSAQAMQQIDASVKSLIAYEPGYSKLAVRNLFIAIEQDVVGKELYELMPLIRFVWEEINKRNALVPTGPQ